MKPSKSEFPEEGIAMVIVLVVLSLLWLSTASAGPGSAPSVSALGAPIMVPTFYANSPSGMRPDPTGGPAINTGTPLRKFVDTLPGLGAAGANNLGQYIPIAVPEKWIDGNGNATNDDYYEIAVVEYTERMHSDLFKADPSARIRADRDPGDCACAEQQTHRADLSERHPDPGYQRRAGFRG